jgi:hypothetical protein
MTKFGKLKAHSKPKPFLYSAGKKMKTRDDIIGKRAGAMEAGVRALRGEGMRLELPTIVIPGQQNEPQTPKEIQNAVYYGMVLALSWVLGEEGLPPSRWSK